MTDADSRYDSVNRGEFRLLEVATVDKTRRMMSLILNVLAGMIGAAAIATMMFTGENLQRSLLPSDRGLTFRMNDAESRLHQIEVLLNEPGNAITYDVLGQKLKTLEEGLQAFETAVGSDPIRAMSIPLLRKDIENLQAMNFSLAKQAGTNQTITMMIVVALFGLLGSNLIQSYSSRRTGSNPPPETPHAADPSSPQ